MGCGASTEGNGAARASEGKYPNRFFNARTAAVNEVFVDKATSADPIFEIERVSTVYLLQQPTCVELVHKSDESPLSPTTARVSWVLFNDSKSAANFSTTFFHAEHIAVLCGFDPDGAIQAKEESPFCLKRDDVSVSRKGDGADQRLTVSMTLKPGQTLPFVDGVTSGGYMWKCLVESKGGDLMSTPLERP